MTKKDRWRRVWSTATAQILRGLGGKAVSLCQMRCPTNLKFSDCGEAQGETPRDDWHCGALIGEDSLVLTYFRGRKPTIIGAVLFHGPVRDGKGWYRDAMGTRLKLVVA
jgi:hypothetical protein